MIFKQALLALALVTSPFQINANLGTNDLERYDYSLESFTIDDDCEYTLEFKFKPNDDELMPTEPWNECDPSVVPPVLAPDGLPYYAFRWYYDSFPENVKESTEIDHVSIDFNPCGHPPVGVFTKPHYDVHIYRATPEERMGMTCDLLPGAPVCDFRPGMQSTPEGKAFFNVMTILGTSTPANMPLNFVVPEADMVPYMGGHAWSTVQLPTDSSSWTEPIWISGTYNGDITSIENMFPIDFYTGSEDKTFEETLTYNGQTIMTLPSSHSAKYDATTGYITMSLKGASAVCPSKSPKASKGAKASKGSKVKGLRKARN